MSATPQQDENDFLLLKSLELAQKLLFPQVSAPPQRTGIKWEIKGSDPTNQQFKPTLYLTDTGKFIPAPPPKPASTPKPAT